MQYFVFFKQKTAYELRISDWSSDVCSSDLKALNPAGGWSPTAAAAFFKKYPPLSSAGKVRYAEALMATGDRAGAIAAARDAWTRSEEHTSELQSLMRISYAVFCLKKKNTPRLLLSYITYNQRNDASPHTGHHQ